LTVTFKYLIDRKLPLQQWYIHHLSRKPHFS